MSTILTKLCFAQHFEFSIEAFLMGRFQSVKPHFNVDKNMCKTMVETNLNIKALRNNFCFGKSNEYNSRVTSITRETQKQRLNLLYNEFGRYLMSFIVISIM